jgi:integrase
MSDSNSREKHITVWAQKFGDRPYDVLQWHDPVTGKRKSKSAGTCNPIAVERARAALEYELNHGLYREASAMSWERFRGLFEDEYLPNCRPWTRKTFATVFNRFESLCTPNRLGSINERTVSAFAAGLRKRPGRRAGTTMEPSTIAVYLNFLHVALGWAKRQKLIPELPAFPVVQVPKKDPQPVPAESFERLLAKAENDPQMRAYLLCGWLAGLRLAEALALEWEESEEVPYLDLSRDRIVLPAKFVKAVKPQWLPLDATLRAALLALSRRGRKVFHFTDHSGRPIGEVAVSHRVVDLAKRAGVKLTMRTLRKGFGCYYASRVPAQVLQKLMRHADIKTTMNYYANVDDAVQAAVAQRNSSRNTSLSATGPSKLLTPQQPK